MQRLRDARRQGGAHARALALGTQSRLVLHSQKVQNKVLSTLGYTGVLLGTFFTHYTTTYHSLVFWVVL